MSVSFSRQEHAQLGSAGVAGVKVTIYPPSSPQARLAGSVFIHLP